MSSLFRQIFSCCLRPRPTSEPDPSSTTPSTSNSHDAPGPTESERQKVKERLGNIVRSKRGKMVNVADHLPFNLNNRSIPGASTSRLRTESPSPHPSMRTGDTSSTSRSGSLRRPLQTRFSLPREPALSVRLVKGREGTHRGGTARGRLGRFGEERGIEWVDERDVNETHDQSAPKDNSKTHIPEIDKVPPEIGPLTDIDRNHILTLSEQIGRQLRDGWEIGDAGPIARGWGD